MAFGYFVVLPVGLRFMIGYGGDIFNQLLQAERYITFVSMFLLAFGVVFELPLVMMLLAWAGIVDHVQDAQGAQVRHPGRGRRRHGVHSQPGPLSMGLMLVPLIVLYEFGIWLAKFSTSQERSARRSEAAEATPTSRAAEASESPRAKGWASELDLDYRRLGVAIGP